MPVSTAGAALDAGIALAGTASAGECPTDKVVADGQGQTPAQMLSNTTMPRAAGGSAQIAFRRIW